MRLKPELSADKAYEMLAMTAAATWGLAEAALLETNLRSIAAAMATISAVDVPDDTEPLFGEEAALDAMES